AAALSARAATIARTLNAFVTRRMPAPSRVIALTLSTALLAGREGHQRQDRPQRRANSDLWLGGRLQAFFGLALRHAGLHGRTEGEEVVRLGQHPEHAVVEVWILVALAAAERRTVGPRRRQDQPVWRG